MLTAKVFMRKFDKKIFWRVKQVAFGSPVEQKKVKKILKNILEHFHLKFPVYKMMIAPSQEIALHRLRKIIQKSTLDNKKYNGQKILFS